MKLSFNTSTIYVATDFVFGLRFDSKHCQKRYISVIVISTHKLMISSLLQQRSAMIKLMKTERRILRVINL